MANTRLCSIPDCGKPVYIKSRGWCKAHYSRWQKYGDPLIVFFEKKTKLPHANHLPEYRVWDAMKGRCTNPRHKSFGNYGGRGITVCQRWLDSFDAFLEDVGYRPAKGFSLDRIDNEKGYEPGNCRWATAREQMNNVRYNRLVTINGQTKTRADWCRIFGIREGLFDYRVRNGWSDVDAITTPTKRPPSQTPAAIRVRALRAKRKAEATISGRGASARHPPVPAT